MKQYQNIQNAIILSCVVKMRKHEFDTKEFIKEWMNSKDSLAKQYPGIGTGWKSVVGRNLSRFALDIGKIASEKRKRNGAEVWLRK